MMPRNVCTNKFDEIVDKDNNTYRAIKMKPADVHLGMYIDYYVEHNGKDPKFKHCKLVGGSLCDQGNKKILCHGLVLFVISVVKKLLEHSMKKSSRRQVKKIRIAKVIKVSGDGRVKRKGYDNSFNNWIGMKDIV